jgi:hypothetical protein
MRLKAKLYESAGNQRAANVRLTAAAQAACIAAHRGQHAQEPNPMKPAAPSAATDRAAHTVTVEGHYAIDTWSQGQSYSAVAYVVVPKVAGGIRYIVTGTGFNDTAYYGKLLSLSFSPAGAIARPADGYGDTRVQDRGVTLWVCLSSISGPISSLAEAVPYFDARFGGMRVQAVVSVNKTPD